MLYIVFQFGQEPVLIHRIFTGFKAILEYILPFLYVIISLTKATKEMGMNNTVLGGSGLSYPGGAPTLDLSQLLQLAPHLQGTLLHPNQVLLYF